ncbi:endolytic transglycosylase MltG [Kineobactrum salinum]|uniref:endolytic transglycosylase MltG n=1 Tax=Kineobactrum salinum TaxID=2708301 RepID=UPI0022B2957D|nr:endolytic transglycosylase MltG [Kineobactrum salinum]
MEGLFLPETYRFERGTSDLDILARAHRAMLAALTEEWELRAPDLPYETPYEALIMASIIERETGVPDERQQIAGVFVRRLQRGMRLQTDPTTIYGLGTAFDGNLVRSHLRDGDNIYNTYRHHGLPPTPIALPGRAALHAALQPAEGDSLYFVARGDGSHEFNSTLEGHERAVRKYQLERRENYRSRPGTE